MTEFKLDTRGAIVGYGITIPTDEQLAPGVIIVDIALLNRLVRVMRLYEQASHTPTCDERAAARIRAAKEDLIEDLGLDPTLLDFGPSKK